MIDEIKVYLQMTAKFARPYKNKHWPYSCISDFILKHGKVYRPHYFDKIQMGRLGKCYSNAFNFIQDEGECDFRYVEGFAYTCAYPMAHAWAAEGNHAFDPTWENGIAYFGVEFPMSYVREISLQRKRWGVIDAWDIGFPLLTGEHEYPITENYIKGVIR